MSELTVGDVSSDMSMANDQVSPWALEWMPTDPNSLIPPAETRGLAVSCLAADVLRRRQVQGLGFM